MQAELGPAFPAFLQALDQPPPVSIRLNPAKKTERFRHEEKVTWHPEGRYLPVRPSFTLDPAFHAGAYYVQEASSMLLFEALRQTMDLQKKLRVLDLCAAPGGKSTLLLSAISSESFLLANEAIQSRISPLKMNLEKWGHANYAVSNHDPEDFQALVGYFDVVLADAPCSGEGLFRKDEAAAGEWSEAGVELCAARQRRILSAAQEQVRPGGVLVYSTCTFNELENENNLAWLLAEGGFEHCPLQLDPVWGIVEKKYGYQCYPHRVKGEGFFMACLRKTGEEAPAPQKISLPKDWQRLPEKQTAIFADWLAQPADFEFFMKPTGETILLPKAQADDFFLVSHALKKRSFGVEIGEFKKQDFVPSHALALANYLHPEVPKVLLERERALSFLKKENIWQDGWGRGWTLAGFDGLGLGWLKVLDHRSNNYLPMEWRIRMSLKDSSGNVI